MGLSEWAKVPAGVLQILDHIDRHEPCSISDIARYYPSYRESVRSRLEWLAVRQLIAGLGCIVRGRSQLRITDQGREALDLLRRLDAIITDSDINGDEEW